MFWFVVVIVIIIIFFPSGLKIVQQQERFVMEFLGKFSTILNPGLRWIFPFLMKTRAIISIWEQSIDLFLENPDIDFREGGTAKLIKPKVWVEVKDVYKAIYNVANWRQAVKERVEDLLRDALSNQSVEEIIDQTTIHPWWDLVKREFGQHNVNPEQEILDDWGVKITRVTIPDFGWSEEVIKTRREVFEAQRQIKREKNLAMAAKHEARKKAQESGGMHGQIKKILVKNYSYLPKDAEKVAGEYVKYFRGTETHSIVDWRTSGEGWIEMIAKGVAVIEKAKEMFKPKKEEETKKGS